MNGKTIRYNKIIEKKSIIYFPTQNILINVV